MWKTLSPRSNPSLKNERSTLCCSSRLLKKAQMWRCSPRIPPAHCTEPTVVATFHLLLLGRDNRGRTEKVPVIGFASKSSPSARQLAGPVSVAVATYICTRPITGPHFAATVPDWRTKNAPPPEGPC